MKTDTLKYISLAFNVLGLILGTIASDRKQKEVIDNAVTEQLTDLLLSDKNES